jgi:hypothetical protein
MSQSNKSAIVVMPLNDEKLYNGKTPGDYIFDNSIPNAMIVGTCFSSIAGMVKTMLFITTDVNDTHARAATEQWWMLPENKGPKLAVWLPLNDMKEMTASGLEKHGEGVQGQSVGLLIRTAGVQNLVSAGLKRMCKADPTYVDAFNAVGNNWGDKIVA